MLATPLLLVLLVVEWSDLVFAIDSIPAIFAITRDPFLVYSSNVFAILGLRALFFVLAGMMDKFVYLKPGVALILVFVGLKMTLSHWVHVPTLLSLAVIVLILTAAVVLSLRRSAREARHGGRCSRSRSSGGCRSRPRGWSGTSERGRARCGRPSSGWARRSASCAATGRRS